MKKLDFRNFSVPTGITRQTREVFDAREQIADLLYTRVSGIKAHRLAFKIFESTGETEFSDEETGMIHMAVEDRKSTRLNSSHRSGSRMPASA